MLHAYADLLVLIHSLEPIPYWIGLMFAFVGSIYFLWLFVRSVRHRRLMQDTPRSKIRSASQGYVEVAGHARALDGALKSPGRSRPCVWYRFRVEDTRDQRDQNWSFSLDSFSRIFDLLTLDGRDAAGVGVETSFFSFYVDDGTGMCSVDPTQATVKSRKRDVWRQGHMRYTEELIVEGEQIYCLGDFKTVQGFSRQKAIKETARATLNEWKTDAEQMKSFDTDGDGQIDMDEWESARGKAREQAKKEVGEDYERTEHHELVKPFDRGHPFIVSAFSEAELTKKDLITTALSLPGFVVFGFLTGAMVHSAII